MNRFINGMKNGLYGKCKRIPRIVPGTKRKQGSLPTKNFTPVQENLNIKLMSIILIYFRGKAINLNSGNKM